MSTLNIRPLNSELQLVAREELHENPDQIEENLVILKQWIEKSAHLNARTDDQFLIAFLRGCKYSLERTKQKIDMYYTYRTHLPEIVGNRDPVLDKISEVIKCGISFHASRVTIEDVFKVFTMVNDVLMVEDDNSVVAGQTFVVDMGGLSMGHVIQMHPAFLKKAIMIWQESSPIRPKAVHYINAPKIFEQLFALIKSLLNDKIRNRLFMHSSLDSFYSIVPRELMPNEYDGKAGSLQTLCDEWEKKLLSYRNYFLDDGLKYGVDEKKRIGAAKNPLLGIEGTFKKLQVD